MQRLLKIILPILAFSTILFFIIFNANKPEDTDASASQAKNEILFAKQMVPKIGINNNVTAALYYPEGDFKENVDITLPDNWIRYTSSDIGISFSYPLKWGEVKVNKILGNTGVRYLISFSNNHLVRGVAISNGFYDENTKPESFSGFVNYEEVYKALENSVVAKGDLFLVYTNVDMVDYFAATEVIIKLKTLPGIRFQIINEEKLSSMVYKNILDFGINPNILYYSEESALTLIRIANSVLETN